MLHHTGADLSMGGPVKTSDLLDTSSRPGLSNNPDSNPRPSVRFFRETTDEPRIPISDATPVQNRKLGPTLRRGTAVSRIPAVQGDPGGLGPVGPDRKRGQRRIRGFRKFFFRIFLDEKIIPVINQLILKALKYFYGFPG